MESSSVFSTFRRGFCQEFFSSFFHPRPVCSSPPGAVLYIWCCKHTIFYFFFNTPGASGAVWSKGVFKRKKSLFLLHPAKKTPWSSMEQKIYSFDKFSIAPLEQYGASARQKIFFTVHHWSGLEQFFIFHSFTKIFSCTTGAVWSNNFSHPSIISTALFFSSAITRVSSFAAL